MVCITVGVWWWLALLHPPVLVNVPFPTREACEISLALSRPAFALEGYVIILDRRLPREEPRP